MGGKRKEVGKPVELITFAELLHRAGHSLFDLVLSLCFSALGVPTEEDTEAQSTWVTNLRPHSKAGRWRDSDSSLRDSTAQAQAHPLIPQSLQK